MVEGFSETPHLQKEILAKGKTVLLVGATGYVGSELMKIYDNCNILIPKRNELNTADLWETRDFLQEYKPDIIVNCSGYTKVDEAETKIGYRLALEANVFGLLNLVVTTGEVGSHLITLGSDFVYPGTPDDPGPYSPGHKLKPKSEIGNYGLTKLQGELLSQAFKCRLTTIGISFPFGDDIEDSRSLICKLRSAMKKGYGLYDDQYITPTYIPDLGHVIEEVINKQIYGKLHIACKPLTTPYLLGRYIAILEGLDMPKVSHFQNNPEKSPRPQFGGFKVDSSYQLIGSKPLDVYKILMEIFKR